MKLAERVTKIVDFFYVRPLHKVISRQNFRYIACGGANMLFGWVLYNIALFSLGGRSLNLGFMNVPTHMLAQFIYFPFYFLVGFWLQRNVTFRTSPLKQGNQMFRYLLQNAGALVVNTLALALFVDVLGIHASIAKPMADMVTVIYSYFTARFFTFSGGWEKNKERRRVG